MARKARQRISYGQFPRTVIQDVGDCSPFFCAYSPPTCEFPRRTSIRSERSCCRQRPLNPVSEKRIVPDATGAIPPTDWLTCAQLLRWTRWCDLCVGLTPRSEERNTLRESLCISRRPSDSFEGKRRTASLDVQSTDTGSHALGQRHCPHTE